MKNFKGIIMSEYTSQLTILRHFPKIFSMIHMPPIPIASAGCDTTLFLCKKLIIKFKIYSKLEYMLFHFFKIFQRKYIHVCPPKPLAINHRAALSLFHRYKQ